MVGENVLYKRITRTLNDPGKLIPITETPFKYIKDDRDYYLSLYSYNDEQHKRFKETGTISGIEDVVTSKLVFDFDSDESGSETARKSAISLCGRLLKPGTGITEDSLQLFWSGGRGFHIEVDTDSTFTPEQFKNTVFALAKDLPGFDVRIRNASRVLRLPLTRHPESGLYKKPLTLEFLKSASIEEIKAYAADVNDIKPEDLQGFWGKAKLSPEFLKLKEKKLELVKKEPVEIRELDLSKKPSWLSSCKFALSQGFFKSGQRNDSLTCLAATYKAQGLPEDVVEGMVKGVAKLQSSRNNEEPHAESKIDALIKSVFRDNWRGGQFSCKNEGWLQDYCREHGFSCSHDELEETAFKGVDEILDNYEKYMEDINDNTIKTGIEDLDKEVRLQTSMVIGIVGSPSSGKTTVSLKMLRELNKTGRKGAFYSLDMGEPLIGQKLIQAVSNVPSEQLDTIFATTPRNLKKQLEHGLIKQNEYDERMKLVPEYQKKIRHWRSLVREQTKDLDFSFKSAISVEQIKRDVLKQQEKTGQKVWLVMIDYAECISGPHADSTANMASIFLKLKDLANDLQTCVVVLLQPNKFAGDPGDVIESYRQIKGSSVLEQSSRVIIGIHREGYDPERYEEDKFITLTVLKNNMGKLAKVDAYFDGERGEISKLDNDGRIELRKLRARKESEASKDEF